MDGSDITDHSSVKAPKRPHDPGRPDLGKAVLAVNGVIAAVGGTYASTHSLAATVVAGCADGATRGPHAQHAASGSCDQPVEKPDPASQHA